MSNKKSLVNLKQIFQKLSSVLGELDREAIRDLKFDVRMLPARELNLRLQESSNEHEKRELLLTEIGYLRINIFQEYWERIQILQKNQDLSRAVKLMDDYIKTIAFPFIQERLNPSLIDKITRCFSADDLPDAGRVLEEWNTEYAAWFSESGFNQMLEQKALEKFNEIKKTFFTLYTISFSFENFPPVATEPSH